MGEVPTGSPGVQGEKQSASRCMLIRSWTLRWQLVNYAVKLLPRNDWEMGAFSASSVLNPG